jgi:hypothetical protein
MTAVCRALLLAFICRNYVKILVKRKKHQGNCPLNSSAMLNDSLVNYHAKRSSNIQREQLVRSLELCGDVEDPADGNQ